MCDFECTLIKPPVSSSHYHPLTVFSSPPPQYFVLLLCIFLLEVLAGVLAYIYYQQVIRFESIIKKEKKEKSFQIHFIVHLFVRLYVWNYKGAADRYGKTRY